VFAEIPPRVEYSLTPAGQALEPVLRAMCEWGQVQVMREPADFEKVLAAVR
jgi:DNA-binding HxlR family transcriptional regulator